MVFFGLDGSIAKIKLVFLTSKINAMTTLIWTLIVAALAGCITGVLMRGTGFGFVLNVLLGLAGGWFGSWAFQMLGITPKDNFIATLITSVLGASLLVLIVRRLRT